MLLNTSRENFGTNQVIGRNEVDRKAHSVKMKIGESLANIGLIGKDKLRLMLIKQINLRNKGISIELSELFIDEGLITRDELIIYLELAGIKLKIGEILYKDGFIKEDKLSTAIKLLIKEKINGNNIRMGEILIKYGIVGKEIINNFITTNGLNYRLGEMLLHNGIINKDQLYKALEKQKNEPSKKLGEILIEIGFISRTDLFQVLSDLDGGEDIVIEEHGEISNFYTSNFSGKDGKTGERSILNDEHANQILEKYRDPEDPWAGWEYDIRI